jgi:DNA-binding transcriptional regulator YbjK
VSVEDVIARLFNTFVSVNADRIRAFCDAIERDCSCPTCVAFTAEELAKSSPRMVVPAQFITAYRATFDVEHYRHVGQSTREAEVGKAEAFWRKDAPKAIREVYGCTTQEALLISAQMWASETLVPDVVRVAEDCSATRLWLDAVGSVSETRIEAAFALARAIASKDPLEMTDAEWREVTA